MGDNGINYRLRPAKNAERSMMAELLSKISHIKPIQDYTYIGFGSEYFTDFNLFHRRFGFDHMISIEHSYQKEARMNFNKPFDCIDLIMKKSSQALPNLDLSKEVILWLDYTDELQKYMLDKDLHQFFTQAKPGSLVFITLNAEPEQPKNVGSKTVLERFADQIGKSHIPADIRHEKFVKYSKHDLYRELILREIWAYLKNRNLRLDEEDEIEFHQLVNFSYADNAQMMTFGGIISDPSLSKKLDDARLDDLPFVKTGEEKYRIPRPNLTFKEMRRLDEELPGSIDGTLDYLDDEIEEYSKVYRHFPRFVESVL